MGKVGYIGVGVVVARPLTGGIYTGGTLGFRSEATNGGKVIGSGPASSDVSVLITYSRKIISFLPVG